MQQIDLHSKACGRNLQKMQIIAAAALGDPVVAQYDRTVTGDLR
jgi:hypothetical protein